MYDILQLNDMLVPELLDIAEQLKIQNAKKLDKQELIYKILDKQAVKSMKLDRKSSPMPSFRDKLSAGELDDLVAYLAFLKEPL